MESSLLEKNPKVRLLHWAICLFSCNYACEFRSAVTQTEKYYNGWKRKKERKSHINFPQWICLFCVLCHPEDSKQIYTRLWFNCRLYKRVSVVSTVRTQNFDIYVRIHRISHETTLPKSIRPTTTGS